jgi:dethiobiotin synthetase
VAPTIPLRGLFVTGTGTEIGKSVAAAVIARTAASSGARVRVYKPAVSGLDQGGEPDHVLLRRAAGSSQVDDEIAPYRYGPAVSPHLAAELAGEPIEPQRLRDAAALAAAGADLLVCEGVGGLLVPLAGDYLVRDLARDLGLPMVVVAAPGLGTINHTLLTLEAIRAVGLEVRAVVLNPWPEVPSRLERSNRDSIAALGDVEVTVLPTLDPARPETWPRLDLSAAGGPQNGRLPGPRSDRARA